MTDYFKFIRVVIRKLQVSGTETLFWTNPCMKLIFLLTKIKKIIKKHLLLLEAKGFFYRIIWKEMCIVCDYTIIVELGDLYCYNFWLYWITKNCYLLCCDNGFSLNKVWLIQISVNWISSFIVKKSTFFAIKKVFFTCSRFFRLHVHFKNS